MAYPLTFKLYEWQDLPSTSTPFDKTSAQGLEKRLVEFIEKYEVNWRKPVGKYIELYKAPEVAKGDVAFAEEQKELYYYTGTEWKPTVAFLGSEVVKNSNIENLAVTAAKIANETILAAQIKKETITGAKLANETITPKQLQGGATPDYTGEIEIKANEEIEASATARQLVSITIESKTSEAATYTIFVNKKFVKELSVGAAILAPSLLGCDILVPATHKYEVKISAGEAEKIYASAVTI